VKAVEQMEERLAQFVEANSSPDIPGDVEAAGALRFAHNQVIKLADDCLQKSRDKLVTSALLL
jgi:microtubule-associated serine/threonine kinase